jgi:hypothetical protein
MAGGGEKPDRSVEAQKKDLDAQRKCLSADFDITKGCTEKEYLKLGEKIKDITDWIKLNYGVEIIIPKKGLTVMKDYKGTHYDIYPLGNISVLLQKLEILKGSMVKAPRDLFINNGLKQIQLCAKIMVTEDSKEEECEGIYDPTRDTMYLASPYVLYHEFAHFATSFQRGLIPSIITIVTAIAQDSNKTEEIVENFSNACMSLFYTDLKDRAIFLDKLVEKFPERAKEVSAVKDWLFRISGGKLDEQYWKDLRVGKVNENYWAKRQKKTPLSPQ